MAVDIDVRFDPRTDVDITGLEWWEVLQRLHHATRAAGPFARNQPLTNEAAIELIAQHVVRIPRRDFTVVNGRPLNIGFHTKYGQSWIRGVPQYDQDSPVPASVTVARLRAEKGRQWRMIESLPRRWSP